MNFRALMAPAIPFFVVAMAHAGSPESLSPAAHIDRLIDAKLHERQINPNPPIDDATFVRRVYLDLSGRIPTLEEAEEFYTAPERERRRLLIETLLDSEGYVSHFYDFWADILRIKTRLGINETPPAVEYAYRLWLKRALRENMPYDVFVRKLVSAQGHFWENGAIGYYQRDRGMPLDHMSNTVRIFLGTRLECAQCHDHPFDHWTQMDYYQMAAFSYRMVSRDHTHANSEALDAYLEQGQRDAKVPGDFKERALRIRKAEENLHIRVRYITTKEVERSLQLPHDYQYSDAKPFDEIKGRTMFGEAIPSDSSISEYAAWMTSRENPTFTRVIANRLWKHLFGTGVYEPVDEITEGMAVSNPELMSYLEKLMRDLDYDMKAYLAILCQTEAYQRAASEDEFVPGSTYYFQGPLLRRMTAEQVWDSVVGLVLPEVDSYRPSLKKQLKAIEQRKSIYDNLVGIPPDEYISRLKDLGDTMGRIASKLRKVRQERSLARTNRNEAFYRQKTKEEKALQGELARKIASFQKTHPANTDGDYLMASFGMTELSMKPDKASKSAAAENVAVMTQRPKPPYPKPPGGLDPGQLREWRSLTREEYLSYLKFGSDWARASELPSPAPRGHFLRDFGQSDRNLIENSNLQASVPQALHLLNGPAAEALMNRFSLLGRRLHTADSPEEKIRLIFQAILTRQPNEKELAIARAEFVKQGHDAFANLAWALLNTPQFLFVR